MKALILSITILVAGHSLADVIVTEELELDIQAEMTGRVIQFRSAILPPEESDPEENSADPPLSHLIRIARGHVAPPDRHTYLKPEFRGAQLRQRGMEPDPGFKWIWHFWFVCNIDRSIASQAGIRDGKHTQEVLLLPSGEPLSLSYRDLRKDEGGGDNEDRDPFATPSTAEPDAAGQPATRPLSK